MFHSKIQIQGLTYCNTGIFFELKQEYPTIIESNYYIIFDSDHIVFDEGGYMHLQ